MKAKIVLSLNGIGSDIPGASDPNRKTLVGGRKGGKGGGNEGVPKMILTRLHVFL